MSMMGLGGLARRRPDQEYRPAGQGVTPGARSSIFARLVVIFGTGNARGLFVYNGKPANGNPPVFAVVAPGVTTDPYGNPVTAVMQAGIPGTGLTQIDAAGNILLSPASGSPVLQLRPADQRILFYIDPAAHGSLWLSASSNSGTDAFANAFPAGLATFGNLPFTAIALALASAPAFLAQVAGDTNPRYAVTAGGAIGWGPGNAGADASFARAAAGLLQAAAALAVGNGTPVTARTLEVRGDAIASLLNGWHPGAVGTTEETWQSMNGRGYQNGWTDSGTNVPGRFRLVPSPSNCIQVQGSLQTPLNPPDGQVVVNLPLAYRPQVTYPNFTGRCIVPSNAAVQARFNILSNGNLTIAGAAALAAGVEIIIPGGAMYSTD